MTDAPHRAVLEIDLDLLAEAIARRLPAPRVEIVQTPDFATSTEFAELLKCFSRRQIEDAARGRRVLLVNGREVRLPDSIGSRGRKGRAWYWRRRPGVRSIEDFVAEVAAIDPRRHR